MRSPLHLRIASLRGRARRLLALHGLSLVVAGLAAFTVLACLADWSIHLAREVRVGLLVAMAVMVGYLVVRYVVAPLVVRFRDLDIAMKVEARWPGLNDRLASTIQFLDLERAGVGDREDVLGSRALREATVKQTLAETDAIDFRSVIDPRPARRAMMIGAAAVCMGLAVFSLDARLGGIALKRLYMPLASNPWPQMTHLAILNAPPKIAKGDTFVLEVGVAKGERAPSTAKITYKYEDGETATESLRPDDRGKFHGRKESVEKSFSFTVAAGDDITAKRSVTVVPPPVVTATTVKLTFPAYTSLTPQTLAADKATIAAVRGTTVELMATASKPLASASLVRGEGQKPIAVAVDETKPTALAATFTLDESGPITIAMTDTEGFRSQERDAVRFDLRSIKDEAPKVTVDDPANDRDVTPNADVPVEITADDDFGLGAIRLVYTVSVNGSEPGPEVLVPLWASPVATKEKPSPAIVKSQTVKYLWKLEPLKLPIGAVLTFHADARDLDSLKGPNIGKSRELRLRIVAPEQLAPVIDGQRREIKEAIERTLAMQKQAIPPVRDAIRALEAGNPLDQARKDEVKNAEPVQQQVTDRIANKTDGLEAMIRRHLDDLANLKIDNPDAKAQMEEMLAGVERLRDQNLGPAAQELARAAKGLETGKPQDGAKPEDAAKAGDPADAPEKGDAEKGEDDKGDTEKGEASAKSDASKSDQPKAKAKSGQAKAKTGESKSGESKKSDADAQAGEDSKAGDEAKAGESKSGEAPKSKSGDSAKSKASPSAKSQEGGKPEAPKPGDSAKPEPPQGPQSPLKDSLDEAAKNQKVIADELQKMKDSLGEFETYRGVVQEAKNLLKQHEEAMKAASEVARKGEQTGDAAKEQQAEQKSAADRQNDAARDLAALENKMDDMAKRLGETDPASAAALKEAAQQSRQKGTTEAMKGAAEKLQKGQTGEAQKDQKEAQQDLKKLVDNLQNRRENELARLVKDLKDAEKELAGLQDRQKKNRDQTAKANQEKDPQAKKEQLQKLSKEQKKIQEDLKKTLLKLQKARAELAAQAADKAQAKMAEAGKELEEADPEDAEQMMEEALAGLEEAQDEVEEAIEDAEEQLAMEQLSKIKDHLLAISERQDKMAEETAEYEKTRAAKGLTRAQITGIRSLGRVQEAIKGEAADLTERLDAAPAFALQLKKAADKMAEAAEKLQGHKADTGSLEEPLTDEQIAARKVKQLLDALKPDPPENGGAAPPPGGGGGAPPPGGGRNRGGDGIGMASQLKILKLLQIEINDRTEAIDEIKARKKTLTPGQQAELDGLADDQRQIADLARDLTKPKKSDGEQ